MKTRNPKSKKEKEYISYISSIFHSFENKNVLYISLCFAILFFGYNGAEKFLAVFYTQLGKTNIALITLAIIYLACIPSAIFTGIVIGKLGLRNTLFFSTIIYAAFVFGLITKDIILILFLAFLLGLAAVPLWTAGTTYLLKSAKEDKRFSYGEALGMQRSVLAIGMTFGILMVTVLSKICSMDLIFCILGCFMILAAIGFTRLKKLESEARHIHFNQLRGVFTDLKFWLIAPLFFSCGTTGGISISLLPLLIHRFYDISMVGLILLIWCVSPIITSLGIGRLSDIDDGKNIYSIIGIVLFGAIAALIILLKLSHIIWLALATLLISIFYTMVLTAGQSLIGSVFEEKNWETTQGMMHIFSTFGVILPLTTVLFFTYQQTIYILLFIFLFTLICISFLKNNIIV